MRDNAAVDALLTRLVWRLGRLAIEVAFVLATLWLVLYVVDRVSPAPVVMSGGQLVRTTVSLAHQRALTAWVMCLPFYLWWCVALRGTPLGYLMWRYRRLREVHA